VLTRLAVSRHLNPGPHPNVMPLIDCGYDRPTGRFIIVTEWMDGLSLRDHIRIQTNPVPEKVNALKISLPCLPTCLLREIHTPLQLCTRRPELPRHRGCLDPA
jgi:serine/threonine protein kinase